MSRPLRNSCHLELCGQIRERQCWFEELNGTFGMTEDKKKAARKFSFFLLLQFFISTNKVL